MSLLQKVEGQVQDSVAAVGGRRVRTTDGLYQEYVKNPHAQFKLSAVSLCVLVYRGETVEAEDSRAESVPQERNHQTGRCGRTPREREGENLFLFYTDCSEFDILKQEQTKLREKKVFAHQLNHLPNRL